MAVFVLASALSYLDRTLLSNLAPAIKAEFGLNNTGLALANSVFYIVYAFAAPLAGQLIDRVGLTPGLCGSLALWSLAGIASGFTGSFPALLACRAWLGFAESGNIPASGKTIATYLRPEERALGSGFGQVGISIGMVASPVLGSGIAALYGWRWAFVIAGALGFLWIPLWLLVTSRVAPLSGTAMGPAADWRPLARDSRLWGLVIANMLAMGTYSLWSNWTTVFFVQNYGMTQNEANLQLAWIPPIFAAMGGLSGGALSMRFMKRGGMASQDARLKAGLIACTLLLATAAIPFAPSPAAAAALICWSYFWTVAYSANLYALPLDYFGAAHAGTAIAALTFGFGILQVSLSLWIGWMIDHLSFREVCPVIAIMPLLSYLILRWTRR
jgi:ACS family hexuronate transporter-like MFS transporter